jgi:hypothetical protein
MVRPASFSMPNNYPVKTVSVGHSSPSSPGHAPLNLVTPSEFFVFMSAHTSHLAAVDH